MDKNLFLIIAAIPAFLFLLYIIFRKGKTPRTIHPLKDNDRAILKEFVEVYTGLEVNKQVEFENRMLHFLSTTRITGVNTEVERLDELLIAASAIIPILGFPKWEYMNLNEVLLYPGSFGEKFDQEGEERTMAGVVGDGPYQNIMILSKDALRSGFMNKSVPHNTAIHEFVHLIDKTDGAVDGVPEFLLSKQYVMPWLNMIREKIEEIRQNESDINPYGATNQAEFLAVVSEYFFERPDLLQEKHPELYVLLSKMFRRDEKAEVIE
jgi:Mlc titration factor MtfA (ptsG expression regulator)